MRRIAIGAHAAGVRTRVAVEDRLVILRRRQRHDVAPVAQRDEADLFAAQELFDHQAALQRAERGFGLRRDPARLTTPLPAASPSAFSTTGKPKRSSALRAFAAFSTVTNAAVGIFLCTKKFFAKILLPSSCAASRSGPTISQSARPECIHHAGHQRHFRSDHRQVRADRFRAAIERVVAGTHVATRAMPGFPGAANTSTPGDCASFHASACSRPPLPIIRIFITATMVSMHERYDVVVIGAGHAGCEAARACARMGLRTAMVTMNLDLIAQMSCNPAIGGIAKGHLVREIDALGGVMGEVADAVGIQFRLLNTSRGPAVWSPRAQMDKKMYRVRMREVLESEPNLRIKQAEVAALTIEDGARRPASSCAMAARSARAPWSSPPGRS